MAKDDEVLKGMGSEEALLDFDLDDLSPETLDEEESEEEVIDLVDLVEEGMEDHGAEDDAIANLLEEDGSGDAQQDISISTDEISAISGMLVEDDLDGDEPEAGVADISLSDLEVDEQIDESAQETEAGSGSDAIEAEADFEELDLGFDDEAVSVEDRPEADIPDIDLSGVFGEEEDEAGPLQKGVGAADDNIEEMLGATIEATVTEEVISEEEIAVVVEEEMAPAEPSDEVVSLDSQAGAPALSPEKIEAIVRDVVQEVVERVVRETVAEVAERVITEAIDALRQKIDSSAE
jgi:hypothetical protein